MNHKSTQSFPLKPRRKLTVLAGGILALALVPLMVNTLLNQNLAAFNRIVFFLGILLSIGLAVLAILFSLQARLSFTTQGLLFHQPFVDAECAWDKLKGFRIKKNNLFLVFETGQIKAVYLPPRALKNPEFEIPLHLFIEGWKSAEDWRTHPVLISLRPHLPSWITLPK